LVIALLDARELSELDAIARPFDKFDCGEFDHFVGFLCGFNPV
jgi:hypothetical protein